MILNKINEHDIKIIEKMENDIFSYNSYNYDELNNFNENKNFFFVIQKELENIVGYAICFESIDIIEIYKIAIKNEYRYKGIGSIIIDQIKSKRKKILIEVSDRDNLINFYIKKNFKQINFRKNYYFDKSNAIIMEWNS